MAGCPPQATAVVLNLTATAGTETSFFTILSAPATSGRTHRQSTSTPATRVQLETDDSMSEPPTIGDPGDVAQPDLRGLARFVGDLQGELAQRLRH